MTLAICLRCGAEKFGSLTVCPKCDLAPDTQRDQAYSLAISDHYFTRDVLHQIGKDIATGGEVPTLPPDQEQHFLAAVIRDPNSPLILRLSIANNRAVEVRDEIGAAFDKLKPFPNIIFQLVAGADGKIDKKESVAFESVLRPHQATMLFKSELMRALAQFGRKDVKQGPLDRQGLFRIYTECIELIRRQIAAKFLIGFKDDISNLAFIIANSSGGFFGLSNRVSKVERKVIDQLVLEARKLSLKPRAELEPHSEIISAAQQCIGDMEELFTRIDVKSERLEILGFVTTGLDFIFQTLTKDDVYRRELNALISYLSMTYGISRNDIVAVVTKRAKLYSLLISKSLADVGRSSSDGSSFVQLTWDIYLNVSGLKEEFPPMQIVLDLPIVALTYVFQLVKTAKTFEP